MKNPKSQDNPWLIALYISGRAVCLPLTFSSVFTGRWLMNQLDGPRVWLAIGTLSGLFVGILNIALLIKSFWGAGVNDLTSIVNAVFRVSLLLLSALFLGWALYPEFRPIIMGLIMGMAAGLFNVRFLSMKVQQLAQLAVNPEPKSTTSASLRDCASGF